MELSTYIKTKETALNNYKALLRADPSDLNLQNFIETSIRLSIAKNDKYHNVKAIRFLISEGIDVSTLLSHVKDNFYSLEVYSNDFDENKTYYNLNNLDKIILTDLKVIDSEFNVFNIYNGFKMSTELRTFKHNNKIFKELFLNDLLNLNIETYIKHEYKKAIIDNSYFITEINGMVFYFINDKVIIDFTNHIEECKLGEVLILNKQEITLTKEGLKIYEMICI